MSWLSKLFSAGTSDIVTQIGEAGDKLFTQDSERLELANDLAEIKQKPRLMQAMANLTSASHRHWFVAGGRPALLWVASLGLFIYFPVKMAVGTYIWAKLSLQNDAIMTYPFDGSGLMELVAMLLGLAGLRTAEKIKGVSK